ncbi:MAG: hypothetical protein HUU22_02000 [Phycisphaerae bacterium]|nr:hypothetical protein [Phycisphaerae bacterium]NUQ44787.1 hypothetical protein [Phycisphaerae bacterium]
MSDCDKLTNTLAGGCVARRPRCRRKNVSYLIALIAAAIAACNAPAHRPAPDGDNATAAAPRGNVATSNPPPLSPQLAAFRNELLRADDAAWRRLDMGYHQMKAAVGQIVVAELDVSEFVAQLRSPDPDTRANGLCGLAAARTAAGVDHLIRALYNEPDPYNRTIAVWCLRMFEPDRRVSKALSEFLSACRDIDLGRYLADDGTIRDFKSPFPLAGMEAFKALVALRGRDDMLNGGGWRAFVERVGRHIDPEPITSLNLQRLGARAGAPRTDPDENLRRWIEE